MTLGLGISGRAERMKALRRLVEEAAKGSPGQMIRCDTIPGDVVQWRRNGEEAPLSRLSTETGRRDDVR